MKKKLLAVLSISCFLITVKAQKSTESNNVAFKNQASKIKPQEFEMKKLEQYFSFIPAGKYKMEDGNMEATKNFYMMKIEVPNMLYRLFINDLRSTGKTEDLKLALPDTNAWGDKNARHYGEALLDYSDYYFSHPAYNSYPVVSVSRKGVELFCVWLQDQLKNCKLKAWKDKKVIFRLPTEVEWMQAASGGDSNAVYAWKGPYTRMGNGPWGGDYMANFARAGDGNLFRDENGKFEFRKNENKKYQSYFRDDRTANITAPVNNYWPNAYGLFCMTGNVREMVQEEGFTKGGSWIDPGGECMIDFRNTYQKEGFPCEGFRLVAEIE